MFLTILKIKVKNLHEYIGIYYTSYLKKVNEIKHHLDNVFKQKLHLITS